MNCSAFPDKHRYLSHEEANDAARGIRRRARVLFRAYECDACEGFHLTTRQRVPPQADDAAE